MRLLLYAIALTAATFASGNVFTGTETKDVPKSLDGTWRCIALAGSLNSPPDDFVKKFRIKFAGAKATVNPGDTTVTARIRTDFTKKPAEIDIVPENGPAKGQLQLGLFVLKNDELTIILAQPGLKRPEGMESGTIHMSVILKRTK